MNTASKKAARRLAKFKPALLALGIAQTLSLIPAIAWSADSAQSELEVIGHGQGTGSSYTTDYSPAATGLPLSLRETPQSVSVITRQRIQDQGMSTLDDVLTNTTGITFHQNDNSGRVTYRARGFKISNYKVDGLNSNYLNSSSSKGAITNLDLYDRVEIIRGANGLLGGTGEPSATVDFVRKSPEKQPAASLALTYGRWDQRRIMADLNAPLALEGRVRSRFVVSAEDSNSYLDRMSNKNLSALGNFTIDITPSTVLNFGAEYDNWRVKGASWGTNVPIWYADGSLTDLPRNTNPVPDWAFTDNQSATFFASLEQYFAQNWKTKLAYSHNRNDSNYAHATIKVNNQRRANPPVFAGFWNQDGTGGFLNATYGDGFTKEDSLEWSLNGVFNLLGRSHEIMGGINGYRIEDTAWTFNASNCRISGFQAYSGCQYRANSISIDNWKTWNGNDIPAFTAHRTPARNVTVTSNYGGYLAGRFSLAEPLNAVVGVRLSNYKVHTERYNANNAKTVTPDISNNGQLTPYAGLIYNINDNYAIYASYTSVFNPQTTFKDTEGKILRPITGNAYETGVKSEFFDGRLNASAVLFWDQQKNLAQRIIGAETPDGDQAYSASAVGIKSNGIEFDIAGAITDNWNLYFGYTYLNVNNPNPNANLDDPRHVVRLFTTYQLPGALHGLTIGGGVRAQSHTTSTPNPGRPPVDPVTQKYDDTPVTLSGYTLVDLMARYRFNDKVSLSFNINNLLDKTYYRQRGFYDGQIYGEPRSYWATLTIKY